ILGPFSTLAYNPSILRKYNGGAWWWTSFFLRTFRRSSNTKWALHPPFEDVSHITIVDNKEHSLMKLFYVVTRLFSGYAGAYVHEQHCVRDAVTRLATNSYNYNEIPLPREHTGYLIETKSSDQGRIRMKDRYPSIENYLLTLTEPQAGYKIRDNIIAGTKTNLTITLHTAIFRH
ncbi:hypothetical protein SFRURICE_014654, partial [Spodoptera frugiperda]